ncbi:MAG: acyl-CoA thioesterase [Gammaproteobacteria bacterium]|nr:acyl-CoA thioesterase [Gammaproteobacteria bacterium]
MTQQQKHLTMRVLMTPDMANFSGIVHGGALLQLLDRAAYACAARYSKRYVVTASLDQVSFKEPIKVGELVTIYANVNYVGRTSMEIGIKAVAEDLTSNQQRHTTSCYFTMVAKDDNGLPTPVPKLDIETQLDQKLYEAGKMRLDMRREIEQRNMELDIDISDQFKAAD